ncbi:MAG TPA: hypothetical protein VF316_07680, partial [Polyangiaceae bacterium]
WTVMRLPGWTDGMGAGFDIDVGAEGGAGAGAAADAIRCVAARLGVELGAGGRSGVGIPGAEGAAGGTCPDGENGGRSATMNP